MPSRSKFAQDRRRRELISIYVKALGGSAAVSDLMMVAVRRAAELTTAGECARKALLDGQADIALVVKLEGEARRAVRALGIKLGPKPHVPLRDRIEAEAAE
jgi:hypothetical protein